MLKEDDTLKGRRVVISCDGGRVRWREKKRGPKTKKGRSRDAGAWREPKRLIIYVVNADGRQEKKFSPIIDGGLQGPDIIFERIACYLKALKISEADHVLFIADGGPWIWNRASPLMNELGLKETQVHELIDVYHAIEHVSKIGALRKNLTTSERKKWIGKQRRRLQKGKIEAVVEDIQSFYRGRLSQALSTERDDFIRNQKRMNYFEIKALNFPMGSGAIERSGRRVINLRLKGPCLFWLRNGHVITSLFGAQIGFVLVRSDWAKV